MTYTNQPYPNHRCAHCRNHLPTNERGYCQRCEEGWFGFLDLNNASDDVIEREIGLAEYARTSAEVADRPIETYEACIRVMRNELRKRGENNFSKVLDGIE